MGGPTSSYAAAGIALEFIGAHKPPHPAAECFRQGGDTIEGEYVPVYLVFTVILVQQFSNVKYKYKI
jgi:hypothetical protein